MGGQILNYMTDEQINKAIAMACGWKFIPEYCHGEDQPPEFTTVTPDGRHLCGYYPDYCNDLNAMHEAEVWLKPSLWPTYHSHVVECWIATARQRAEAFLKTLNLWEQ